MSGQPDEDSRLLENLLVFLRGLRELDFTLGPDDVALAVCAAQAVGLQDAVTVKAAVRTVVVQRAQQWALFDLAWQQFRLLLTRSGDPVLSDQTLLANIARIRHQNARPQVVWAGRTDKEQDDRTNSAAGDEEAVSVKLGANSREVLQNTDFAALTSAEQAEIGHFREAVHPLYRVSRRTRRTAQGRELDLSGVMAQYARFGDVIDLPRRRRRTRIRPVVLICDVSGSMDPYSRMLIRFAYALLQHGVDLEAFVFSTRLTRITQALRLRNPDLALAEVAAMTPDFSGGTRLAQALSAFCYTGANRWLRHGAVVMIATDGLDTGDPDELARSAAHIARRVLRLVWLNPALGQATYTPTARGAAILQSTVDEVVPASQWRHLENLWKQLETTQFHRSLRARKAPVVRERIGLS